MMQFTPVEFQMQRNPLVPMLKVTGVAKDLIPKEILLAKVVKVIEKAERFGELIPIEESESIENLKTDNVAIRFYLIFNSEESLKKGVDAIKKELG